MHALCQISGVRGQRGGRWLQRLDQTPAMKTRACNAVQSRLLQGHLTALQRHLARLQTQRARATRHVQEELGQLQVAGSRSQIPPGSRSDIPHGSRSDIPHGSRSHISPGSRSQIPPVSRLDIQHGLKSDTPPGSRSDTPVRAGDKGSSASPCSGSTVLPPIPRLWDLVRGLSAGVRAGAGGRDHTQSAATSASSSSSALHKPDTPTGEQSQAKGHADSLPTLPRIPRVCDKELKCQKDAQESDLSSPTVGSAETICATAKLQQRIKDKEFVAAGSLDTTLLKRSASKRPQGKISRKSRRPKQCPLACGGLSSPCAVFPCRTPPTYHSLGFHPDPSTLRWPGWLLLHTRRPAHRLALARPPPRDPQGRVMTPADTRGYGKRHRLGREQLVQADMQRKRRGQEARRLPPWSTNYGRPLPFKLLNNPVRLRSGDDED